MSLSVIPAQETCSGVNEFEYDTSTGSKGGEGRGGKEWGSYTYKQVYKL